MKSITKAVVTTFSENGETQATFTLPVNICPRLLALYPHGHERARLISRSVEQAAHAADFIGSMGDHSQAVDFSLDCLRKDGELPLSLQAKLIKTDMGSQIVRIGLSKQAGAYA
ncbi:MAG: hypothetical protein AAGI44_00050 [Pseudomonadota bacterium]